MRSSVIIITKTVHIIGLSQKKRHFFYSYADSHSGSKCISRLMLGPVQVAELGECHEILRELIWLHELSSLLMKMLHMWRSVFLKLKNILIEEILPINFFFWVKIKLNTSLSYGFQTLWSVAP